MKILQVVLIFTCCITTVVAAKITKQDVQETTLSNGLTVLIYERHRYPLVSVNVTYDVGSTDDADNGVTGLAHFLEHMNLKGTNSLSAGQLLNLYQYHGGVITDKIARTGKYHSSFTLNMPANKLEFILMFEADRIQSLTFSGLESERRVIFAERKRSYLGNSQKNLHTHLIAHSYLNDPYRNPIIGWTDDIASISLEQLKNFYQKYYRPENITLSIVGDVKAEQVLQLVKNYLGAVQQKPQEGKNRKSRQMAVIGEFPGEIHFEMNSGTRSAIEIGFRVPSDPKTKAILDIISNSLVQRLAENTNVQKVLPGAPSGSRIFSIIAVSKPGDSLAALETALLAEIESFSMTQVEIDLIVDELKTEHFDNISSNENIAYDLGLYNAVWDDWRHLIDYEHVVEQVKVEQVHDIFNKYFVSKNRVIGIIH